MGLSLEVNQAAIQVESLVAKQEEVLAVILLRQKMAMLLRKQQVSLQVKNT